jgi:hypothetical protein
MTETLAGWCEAPKGTAEILRTAPSGAVLFLDYDIEIADAEGELV